MKEKQSKQSNGGGGSPFKSSKKLMKKIDTGGSRPSVGGGASTGNDRVSLGGKKKDKSAQPNEDAPEVARNKSLLHGVLAQKDKSKKTNDDAPEVVRNKSLLQGVTGQGQSANVNIVQGIRIEEVQMGTGRRAESGKKVKVNYVGKFKTTGRVFDASKGRPFSFRLGRSEVIKGWDIGVQGMLVGGKRILTIPPEKAYGKSGAPPTIPPNSTLVFEVTLLEVI